MRRRARYSHLAGREGPLDDYEVATSELLYYVGRGFEVRTPVAEWHERHALSSPIARVDWESFADPDRLSYARYTASRHEREIYLDHLLGGEERCEEWSEGWRALLAEVLPAARYPAHGLHMALAYSGQILPSGRLVVANLFTAADELRRVQRLAYRLAQLQRLWPGFGEDGRARWERDALWQGPRRLVEELLVTYDALESFVGLHLAVKPAFDRVLAAQLGAAARRHGDFVLARMLEAFDEDAAWHRRWAAAAADRLAEVVDVTERRAVWAARAALAFRPLAARLGAEVSDGG